MKRPTDCAHEPCACRAEAPGPYCSPTCEAAGARAAEDCPCEHDACRAASRERERSIHGMQGEGNREADRRYREKASAFAEREDERHEQGRHSR